MMKLKEKKQFNSSISAVSRDKETKHKKNEVTSIYLHLPPGPLNRPKSTLRHPGPFCPNYSAGRAE